MLDLDQDKCRHWRLLSHNSKSERFPVTAAKFLFDEMLDLVGDLDYLVFHIALTVTFASFQQIPTKIKIFC